MFNKLEKYQINGNIVGSVSGFNVDNSDPENVVILETANIDGSNTIGGVWWIDRIVSDRLTGTKQVLHAVSENTLEYGNPNLTTHRFLLDNTTGMKIKVENDEGYILNTLNFDAAQFDTAIPDWSTDLEQKTNF